MQFEACCQWVSQKMAGIQFKESHYQNLLAHKLQREGWIVSSEQNLTYEMEGCVLGFGRLDLVIEKNKKYIVELKQAPSLAQIMSYRNQLRRYLKFSSVKEGFLVVFNSSVKCHIEKISDIRNDN